MSREAPPWLTKWEYAHRGLHSPGVPENSLGAARAAIAAELAIECDVQLSRDNHPMMFHDWQLDRLTDTTGLTQVYAAAELEKLRLRDSDDRIARLASLLEVVDGQVPLLIEIKSRPDYDVERTCRSVADLFLDYRGYHAIMSFDPRVGEWFSDYSPETTRGLVCTDCTDLEFYGVWRKPGSIETADADFVAADVRDFPNAILGLWRETGRPLLSWTIRNQDQRNVAMAHADAIISEGEGIA